MKIFTYISIAAAWIAYGVYQFSISAATLFGLVAVSFILMGMVYDICNAMKPAVAQARDDHYSAPRKPFVKPEAAPSPAPSYGSSEKSPISTDEGSKPLAGMSFALTGKMPVKRAKMECLIEYMGGTIHKRVFSNTSYLVVGESRRVSNKENKAAEWNISEITVEELAQMCGVTYYDIREHYYNIVPREVTGARMMADMRRAEVRQYGKASMNQRTYLKELMQMHQDITLSQPIQVVVKVDEDMELAAVDRLKYNASVGDYHLFTTDGEAIYLDDIRDCSINDIIKAVAA